MKLPRDFKRSRVDQAPMQTFWLPSRESGGQSCDSGDSQSSPAPNFDSRPCSASVGTLNAILRAVASVHGDEKDDILRHL